MKAYWILIVVLVVQLLTGGCKLNGDKEEKEKRIISVSILPQKYFAGKIAGENYQINVLIPPGASPATYEPSPQQLKNVGLSKVYLRTGEIMFEKNWIAAIKDANPDLTMVNISDGIRFLDVQDHHEQMADHSNHDHSGSDPHIWISIKNAYIIARNSYEALLNNFPDDSTHFRKNFMKLNKEIAIVDSAYGSSRSKLKGMDFLIYHPALGYLADEYEMNQYVLEFEGKEPPPSHISETIEIVKKNNIQFIFIQAQFNMDNARAIARETGIEIIQIDPLDEKWNEKILKILSLLTSNS